MKEKKPFNSLVENAFDFLNRAISDFPDSPKYSVIHFYAAVELILKARLMREHWALIITKPECANKADFFKGAFNSVGLKDACARLKAIADSGINQQAYESFAKLATHRNSLMHYFHAELATEAVQMERIVSEQSTAWFFLHDLLTKQWGTHFKLWHKEIRKLDSAMKRHRSYLKVRFNALRPAIKIEKQQGKVFVPCSACGFRSARQEEIVEGLNRERCLVCDHAPSVLSFACPDCHEIVALRSEGFGVCQNCEKAFEPDDVVNALIDSGAAHTSVMDADYSCDLGNCSSCDGYHTVVSYNDIFFCASCFEDFEYLHTCGWCNEPNTGDMEDSYLGGCNHCDGKLGWDKDD